MGVRKHRTFESDLFGHKIGGTSGINSKQKGSNNEREAAVFLEKWTGEKFTRVPSSGGLRWKNSPRVCGDVICENDSFDFKFSVETKHLKDLAVLPVLMPKSKVCTIWKQCKKDSLRASKIPLMLLRKNGMPKGTFYVFLPSYLCKDLEGHIAETSETCDDQFKCFPSVLFLSISNYLEMCAKISIVSKV